MLNLTYTQLPRLSSQLFMLRARCQKSPALCFNLYLFREALAAVARRSHAVTRSHLEAVQRHQFELLVPLSLSTLSFILQVQQLTFQ